MSIASPEPEKQFQAEEEKLNAPAADSARGWLVAAGGATAFFACLGFSNSFGTFQEYYMTHQLQDRSPDEISWIGSLSIFFSFAAGMLGGPLFDRFGAWIIRPAAVAYVFAMMMLSLCKEYWQILLVQGILMGVTMGLLQFPCFAAVAQWFDKKRAAALGVAVAGSSIGGIVIPIVVSKLLNSTSLGFGWSIRIVGFLQIPFLAFSILAVKARLPSRKSTFWIAAAFKDIKFDLLIASAFFMFLGMFVPLFYIPTYAVYRGMDATLAGYLLAILNAASTFGRLIPGILADKYGRLNMFALGGLSTGIVSFCMNSVEGNAGLIVYAVAFGFVSGTIISGASVAFSIVPKNPQDLGTYMGMGMAAGSLASLIGPPVNGVFVDKYGGFAEVCIFSGVMSLVGGFITLATKFATPQGIFGNV